MPTRNKLALPLLILLLVLGSACQASWSIPLTENGETTGAITRENVDFYIKKSEEEIATVPLGQFLYDNGYRLIDQVVLNSEGNDPQTFTWDEIAETAYLSSAGELTLDGVTYPIDSLEIQPSHRLAEVELSLMDLTPTILAALDLPALPDAEGQSPFDFKAQQAVIILTDGTQYDKLQAMVAAGKLPFFTSQDKIYCGLSVYPPITTSASAALMSAAPASKNGVYGYGYRTTDLTTLFDRIIENGGSVTAVEGASLPFNLRNAAVTLSGDKDGNGYSDDNVFQNALDVIENNLPTMLYVHFHEIDDMGHTYGENSPEYEAALISVDTYIAQLVAALPADTLIIITADHGMHTTSDGGNHGTLTAADMLIPITIILK